jgi:hypothetical protein
VAEQKLKDFCFHPLIIDYKTVSKNFSTNFSIHATPPLPTSTQTYSDLFRTIIRDLVLSEDCSFQNRVLTVCLICLHKFSKMAEQQNAQQVVQPAVQPAIQPVVQQQQGVNPVANQPGKVQVAHAQAVQGANGGINLKVKKAKLPEFWGQKDKDSIAAAEFAKRIDWIMSANGWTDEEAYHNFGMALCGSANI